MPLRCGAGTFTVVREQLWDFTSWPWSAEDTQLDNGELVSSKPRYRVASPDARSQPPSNAPQKHVADRVPQRVVDRLEAIEVEAQHRGALASRQAGQRLVQTRSE